MAKRLVPDRCARCFKKLEGFGVLVCKVRLTDEVAVEITRGGGCRWPAIMRNGTGR